ncbi:VOC family protein [Caulobacter sp. KR2-114]|uniref:VOC family protein n=1 Tax=Caulobacter sp. KR2-114 TaxID=3400912 RepID=UPI003C06F489
MSITPTVFYQDPKAALDWLQRAFGFEISVLLTDDAGRVAHAEMSHDGASIGVAGEWGGELLGGAQMKSPASIGGAGTQFIWIGLSEPLDAHHARAAAAGARITQAPSDQFYGDRTYRALDPEGHVWCFRQPVEQVSTDEMERRSGLKVQPVGEGAR